MSVTPLPQRRKLSLWMVTALVVGNMIGSGVFLLPASLAPFFIDSGDFTPFNPSGQSTFGAVTAAAALTLWAFIGIEWAGTAVAIGAIVSAFGALNGWILLQGQVPLAAARDGLFPRVFARLSRWGTPAVGLIVSSVLVTGLMLLNYNAGLVEQFNFVILLATLTTLIPYAYAYAAMAQLMLMLTDRERFLGKRFARDGTVAVLAFAYTLWTIAGSGYEVVYKGTLLLLAGIPVYMWLKYRDRDDTLEITKKAA